MFHLYVQFHFTFFSFQESSQLFLHPRFVLFFAAAMTQCPEEMIIFTSLQHIMSSYRFLVQQQQSAWFVQDAQERLLSDTPNPSERHTTGKVIYSKSVQLFV